MRPQRFAILLVGTAAVLGVLGATIGLTTGIGAALAILAVLHLAGHVWFVTWGPGAQPNRFYKQELWRNQRQVHHDLRAHRRETRDRLAGR